MDTKLDASCDCETLRAQVEELVHGELCDTDNALLRAHLRDCPDCASEEEVLTNLTRAVQRACREKAPESLREIILTRIQDLHD